MLERVRRWWFFILGRDASGRFVSRREREDRQRRLLIIITAALALIVVATLAGGALWQYVLVPRETYATVNGIEIRRGDYEKFRKYQLLQEVTSLNQQFQSASQDQQPQLQQQIALLTLELDDLENGRKNINPDALKDMVDNHLVLQGLEDLGITVTDREVDDYIDQLLAPVPLTEPTATFTLPPTAAAWATETFEEFDVQSTATSEAFETETALTATAESEDGEAPPADEEGEESDITPEAEDTAESPDVPTTAPEVDATEPDVIPTEVLDPDATADPDATVDPDAEATFTPLPTLEPTATPNHEEAVATAQAGFEMLDSNFLSRADMSRGDFERLVAKPALARVKIRDALVAEIEPSQEQVRASHILLVTRDAALELIDGRLQSDDFAEVAADVSIDTGSAESGGDLGWFPRGVMTAPFEEAAFSQPIGELPSEPVQSEFGWHIILVTDYEEDRPLTDTMIIAVQSSALIFWLDEQRRDADISAVVTLPVDDQALPLTGF